MNCPVCGTPLPKNVKECPNCGAVIDWEEPKVLPATVHDTATIRRQALIRLAVEFVRSQNYDAALLTYRRVLKGLKPNMPQYQDIQRRIERVQRQIDTQSQQAQLQLQRFRLLSALGGRIFTLTMQQMEAERKKQIAHPTFEPASNEASSEHIHEIAQEQKNEFASRPTHLWVKHLGVYLLGLFLSISLSQVLRFWGFNFVAQLIFVLMLAWAAVARQAGLLTLEWLLGFSGAYLISAKWNVFSLEQWFLLALEGVLLDLFFFYGANWNLGIKILASLLFVGGVLFLTPLLPLSVLRFMMADYPHVIFLIVLLFLVFSRKPGASLQH